MAKVKKDVEMANKGERPGPYNNLEEDTDYKSINWKKIFLTPKYIPFWILMIVITVITALITIYHDQVVDILRPFSEKVRDLPGGFLIPIVILVVISFPPLFGHEIIGLLCGVVYGLWIGFVIVAIGTFIGEVGTWFAFKKALRRKAEQMERTNLNYAALARVTRDGGFWMVFIIRFSIVPSHFSTAVFSTCDVKFWHFAVATFLTLPKQIFIVYLGVLLVAQDQNNKTQNIVLGITFVVTLIMGVYIWTRMKKAKEFLLREQAARRANHSMVSLSHHKATGSTASSEEYVVEQSQGVMGADVGNSAGSRPQFVPYDVADLGEGPYQQTPTQSSHPYYSRDQKPSYQNNSRQETAPYPSETQMPAQTGREWV